MNHELFLLTVQKMKRQKKSTLLLALILFLSFAFSVVSISATSSMNSTNAAYRFEAYGSWYAAIPTGLEEDGAFLSNCVWLDTLGTARCYAVANGSIGVGTIDEAYAEVGGITLQIGRLPKKEDEIALETSALDTLGYDYTVGQFISLPLSFSAGEEEVVLEKKYRLCGVIKEYTRLWSVNQSTLRMPLVGAVITKTAAEALYQDALSAGAESGIIPDAAVPQYFFTVNEGTENSMKQEVNAYLSAFQAEGEPLRGLALNSAAYQDIDRLIGYNDLYSLLILAATVLSILCVYAVQLREQTRQLALFRSIGITKRQLIIMLLYETLLLGLLAMALGVCAGSLGTYGLLKLFVYTGSAPIKVSIPLDTLTPAALIWLFTILLARLLVFHLALRVPLTGRIQTEHKKARRQQRVCKILIAALSTLFTAVSIFTAAEAAYPLRMVQYYSAAPSCVIYHGSSEANVLNRETLADIAAIPGIKDVRGIIEKKVELSFSGMEQSLLVQKMREFESVYPDSIPVTLYAIDREQWGDLFRLKGSDEELQAFENGDAVYLCFPITVDGAYLYPAYDEDGVQTDEHLEKENDVMVKPGDEISFSVYANAITSAGTTVPLAKRLNTFTTKVAGLTYFQENTNNHTLAGVYSPYTIVCSERFYEKLLPQLDANYCWGSDPIGTEFSYSLVFAYTDVTSDYLGTDVALSHVAKEYSGGAFTNNREWFSSIIQDHSQTLMLLFSGSGCIMLMILLILLNTLTLQAKAEKRSYGILQSLGMSKKQLRRKVYGNAALVVGCSLFGGSALYLLYFIADVFQRYSNFRLANPDTPLRFFDIFLSSFVNMRLNGFTAAVFLLLAAGIVSVLFITICLAKRELLHTDYIQKLREEHE